MKHTFMLLGIFAAGLIAGAQTAPEPDRSLGADFVRPPEFRLAPANPLLIEKTEKPNEIVGKNVTYSGIAVQLAKTDNPLQLINPAAPARYGSSEDNVSRDPMTGKVTGLKIFAIDF